MKSILTSFISSFTILLVTVVAGVLTARLLLPQGKGELTAILLWPTLLAALGSLGVPDAVTYFSAEGRRPAARVLASGLLLIAGLAVALVAAGYYWIPAAMAEQRPEVMRFARMYLAFIPMHLAALTVLATIRGRLHLTAYNALRALPHVITSAGMIALVLAGQTNVWFYALASLVSNLVTLAAAGTFALRHGWLRRRPEWATGRHLIGFGLRAHLGTAADELNSRLDQLLLAALFPAATLGLYVAAVSIGNLGALAANTLALIAFPSIASKEGAVEKGREFARFMRLATALTVLAMALLIPAALWILNTFFGRAYSAAEWPAQILLLAALPLGCNFVFAAGFKALGRPLLASKAQLLGLGVTALALIALLPHYQAAGAAWASLLAYSSSFMYLGRQARRETGLGWREMFLPRREDGRALKAWSASIIKRPWWSAAK